MFACAEIIENACAGWVALPDAALPSASDIAAVWGWGFGVVVMFGLLGYMSGWLRRLLV